MITKDKVEENFKEDFSNLLKKYNAEFDVEVETTAFGPHVVGISVYIPSEYVNSEMVQEETSILFTKWFDSDL